MPEFAPDKLGGRKPIDPRDTYRYSTVKADVEAKPIDAYVAPGANSLQSILSVIGGGQDLLKSYEQYKQTENVKDTEQAAADTARGLPQQEDASRAYIRKYEELQGRAEVGKFHGEALEYLMKNRDLPREEFDKGFYDIQRKYTLGPSDNALRGFAPGALEVESAIRTGYADHQAKKVQETIHQNMSVELRDQFNAADAQAQSVAQANAPKPVYDARPVKAPLVDGEGAPSQSNNLGNIRASKTSFRAYSKPEQGAADATSLLRRAYSGLTLTQIGNKWAPPSDNNNTPAWINTVSTTSGLAPGEVPNLNDPEVVTKLLTGIAKAEKSAKDLQRFTPEVIRAGVESALSGKPIGTNPLAGPQIDYGALAEKKRQIVSDTMAKYPELSDRKRIGLTAITTAYQQGLANHDPHAMDFAFLPDQSGVTIASSMDDQTAARLTEMKHSLMQDADAYGQRAKRDLEYNRKEAERSTLTALNQIDLQDMPASEKGAAKMALLTEAMSNDRISPDTGKVVYDLAKRQAAGNYAEVADQSIVQGLFMDKELGLSNPVEMLKRVNYLAANGFLDEKHTKYFMEQFGDRAGKIRSVDKTRDDEELKQTFNSGLRLFEPMSDNLYGGNGLSPEDKQLAIQEQLTFKQNFYQGVREWRSEYAKSNPNADPDVTPTGSALRKVFDDAVKQTKAYSPKALVEQRKAMEQALAEKEKLKNAPYSKVPVKEPNWWVDPHFEQPKSLIDSPQLAEVKAKREAVLMKALDEAGKQSTDPGPMDRVKAAIIEFLAGAHESAVDITNTLSSPSPSELATRITKPSRKGTLTPKQVADQEAYRQFNQSQGR
jgi:hypothetical protein